MRWPDSPLIWAVLRALWYLLLIAAVALLWESNQGNFRYWGM